MKFLNKYWLKSKQWLRDREPSAYFTIFALCTGIMFLPYEYQSALAASMSNFVTQMPTLRDFVTLVTYQFSHAGWGHLIGNFTFATPVAIWAENRLGRSEFVKCWLWSGICAALGFMVMGMATPSILKALSMGYPVGLVGASGSISGIFTYTCLKFGDNCWWKKVLGYAGWTLFFVGQCIAMGDSIIWSTGIAYSGHVFGSIGALLYMSTRKSS
jgi:membrane associated rhomboid family serine protease